MTHTNSNIIRMANHIANSFSGYSEEAAVKETAEHINAFWETRMRAQLFGLSDAERATLTPVVQTAMLSIRQPA
ncbi:MAG: formate dehydrogenase subunit delta [Gammaproteobacteria bacterium]|nr:formate dehydrogenase subunit delta [Gammaproteobacteria bacterium]